MPGRRNRPKPIVAVGEVVMWVLFALLLFPAGLVGWAVGHYTGHQGGGTRTVTVSASAPATTTAPAPTTTAKAAATTTTAAAAPTAAGKAVFLSAGCAACHTFKAAGATGTIGPDLDTAPEKDAKATSTPLAAFVMKSIVDPGAYLSPGYKNLMPKNFTSTLGPKKISELVSFITGGK
ncbi:MAG TPA: c-type cytochrome [Gaiellaceae bacterium]|nr:c-type cytochrome [Gaiellaceae bacterium]